MRPATPSRTGIVMGTKRKVEAGGRWYRCDLHVHTCLSPCASPDMYPGAIVERAIARGIDMIAICDHNAADNVPYVLEAARGRGISVIPGMEITSREEVHVLALLKSTEALMELAAVVNAHLAGTNREEIFGCQAIVNSRDEVEGFSDRFLLGATDLSLADIVNLIHDLRGLAVAAHIDRPSFSIVSQLGFIDKTYGFDALEISPSQDAQKARSFFPGLGDFPLLTSSDAHHINDIGRVVTTFHLGEATFEELKLALGGFSGRFIEV